ncbi:oxidation resistance protein 1 [Tulasnella sp. 418]|nr:oxidation resistance protein 1 [Tulasnella sp. 418]
MSSTPPLSIKPLIPLPTSSGDSNSSKPESPFTSLFNRSQDADSKVIPLFPVDTVSLSQEFSADKTSNMQGSSLSDSTSPFGDFVFADPLQPNSSSYLSNITEEFGHAFHGDSFIEDAAARSKERGDRVLGELLDHEDDPLYFLRHPEMVHARGEESIYQESRRHSQEISYAEDVERIDSDTSKDISSLTRDKDSIDRFIDNDSVHSIVEPLATTSSASQEMLHESSPPLSSSFRNLTLPRRLTSFLSSSLPRRSTQQPNMAPRNDEESIAPPYINTSSSTPSTVHPEASLSQRSHNSLVGLDAMHSANTFSKKPFIPPTGAPGFYPEEDWSKEGVNSDIGSLNSGHVVLAGRSESSIKVLSNAVADQLRPHLPALARLAKTWTLLYSTDQHGISISTFYSNVEKAYGKGSCLLAVRAADNEGPWGDEPLKDASIPCFGVWIGDGIKHNEGSYYGSGESFLWKATHKRPANIESTPLEVQVFKWTGKNDYVALCESQFISFGGGDGKYGLYIDSLFLDGSSERCDTFENEALCSGHEDAKTGSSRKKFECVAVEVWLVTR